MTRGITIDELAQRTREPAVRLARWHARGMIGDQDGQLDQADIERAGLIRALLGRGVTEDDVARAVLDHRDIIERFLARWPVPQTGTVTLPAAMQQVGLDEALGAELLGTAGLAGGGELSDDDIDALGSLRAALDAGFTTDAMHQLLRVYSDALDRVAEAEIRLFHMHVHERLRAEGLSGDELMNRTEESGDALRALVEPAILYFHRRAWAVAMREDLVNHVAAEAGLWASIDTTGKMPGAVVFVDLCGFTALTSAMGDEAAADVINRFSSIVRRATQRTPGRTVKQIGDEYMLLFPEASTAVRCAVEIERRVADEPRFPAARVGIHWGPILYRDGDYVGANVNLAARLVAEAEPHQVLVTAAVAEAAATAGIGFVPAGLRHLRGVPEAVELFSAHDEAVPQSAAEADRPLDPVCHMELAPPDIAARITIDSVEQVFCSSLCLRTYVANPAKYG